VFEVIYLSLFAISFLAATILPFSSELTLAGLIATSNYDNLLLLIVASFGNVLGSVVNWVLGYYSRNLTIKKWFPFKEAQIERSSKWFSKFGKWSLLFMDFKKGDWCNTMDGLYWRFIDRNRKFFLKNPRLSMMVYVFDKMKNDRKKMILSEADKFIKQNTI